MIFNQQITQMEAVESFDQTKWSLWVVCHCSVVTPWGIWYIQDDIQDGGHLIQLSQSDVYEGCLEIIETITSFSKQPNIIQKTYSHQVLHIWALWLNYLTAIFNGYDPVDF